MQLPQVQWIPLWIPNPNRYWFQFWKPRYIPNPEHDIVAEITKTNKIFEDLEWKEF